MSENSFTFQIFLPLLDTPKRTMNKNFFELLFKNCFDFKNNIELQAIIDSMGILYNYIPQMRARSLTPQEFAKVLEDNLTQSQAKQRVIEVFYNSYFKYFSILFENLKGETKHTIEKLPENDRRYIDSNYDFKQIFLKLIDEIKNSNFKKQIEEATFTPQNLEEILDENRERRINTLYRKFNQRASGESEEDEMERAEGMNRSIEGIVISFCFPNQ